MSRLKSYENLTYTLGTVDRANVVRQFGTGKKHKKNHKMKSQSGRFAIAPILAADALLKKLQSINRLKKVLEQNVKNKSNPLYKVAHSISSVGTSLGYGKKHYKKKVNLLKKLQMIF